MPADMQKLLRDKELILSSINTRGPSLPVHAARAANLSILFASAFLSELFAEGKVKMSRMKVGSSSLYYLSGQEAKLENFVEYLNSREKEAFYLLKKEKILSDEIQEPAIRVALRAISDFAIPIKKNLLEALSYFRRRVKGDSARAFWPGQKEGKSREPSVPCSENSRNSAGAGRISRSSGKKRS
jgi:hypothetical protein